MYNLWMEKETMSLAFLCDMCKEDSRVMYAGDFYEDFEQMLVSAEELGWTVQDFGDACPKCSESLRESEGMEDSRSFGAEEIASELTKDLK